MPEVQRFKLGPDTRRFIIGLHQNGASQSEIARQTKRSLSTVQRALVKAGLLTPIPRTKKAVTAAAMQNRWVERVPFKHQSIIEFPPHLQRQFETCLAIVMEERL